MVVHLSLCLVHKQNSIIVMYIRKTIYMLG